MNKIYKLVWSQVKNTWVAASEMAKSHGKSGQVRGRATLTAAVLGVLMATALPAFGVYAADLTAEQKAIYDAVLAKLEADKKVVHYFSVNSDNLKGTNDKLFDDFTNYSNKLATGVQSMAIGRHAETPSTGAMAVGHHAVAEGFFSVAIGPDALVTGEKITSDQYEALSDEDKQLYAPVDTRATSYLKIKMKATKDGQDSFEEEVNQGVAVGRHARVQKKRGTAIGSYAETYDLQGTALGFEAHATGDNSTALGATAKARAKNAVAIGFGTEAAFSDSVALGSFSRSQTKAGISGWDTSLGISKGAISSDKTHVWTSTLPAISVGNDQKGLTRQIINVAAGLEDTDAVNVAQLKRLREKHNTDSDELSSRISSNNGDISKLSNKVLNMGDDIRNNTANVTNLKAGWTLKDAKSGAKNVKAKDEVKVSGDKYITPVVSASGLSLTVDEKALNKQIANNDVVNGKMESWKLKAGTETDAAEVKDADEVILGVADESQGLTVSRSDKTVKYGIDKKKLSGYIAGDIVNSINTGKTPVTNIDGSFSVGDGQNTHLVHVGNDKQSKVEFVGAGNVKVTVTGEDDAPKLTVSLDEEFAKNVTDAAAGVKKNAGDIATNQTNITNLQAGFSIKDGNGGASDVALGGKDKAAITFKAVTQEGDGTGDALTAAVSDDQTVTYTLNTKKLKQDLGIGDKGVGTMNSWKLKAGDGTAKDVADGDTVAFDVKEPNKGLTVEQDGNTIKYGIDGSAIDLAGNASITNLNKQINDSKIHYFSVNADDSKKPADTNWNNDGATGKNAIAIGKDAKAERESSVVIGLKASSGDAANDGVAVGSRASVTGFGGVAIGRESSAEGQETVAIGTGAKGAIHQTVAIGGYANADGFGAVAIGRNSSSKERGVALGNRSFSNYRGVAVGETSIAEAPYAVAVGDQTASHAMGAVTLGNKTRAFGDSSVAIGNQARVSGKGITPEEYEALPEADQKLYRLYEAVYYNYDDPSKPIVDRKYFKVIDAHDWRAEKHYNSIAIGTTSFVEAKEAIGIGAATRIHGDRGVALGYAAVSEENGTALGAGAQAKANAGVALGEGAVADTAAEVAGYDPKTGKASTETTPTWKSVKGAVSVGNADATRQITNLAAGLADTDAVNVAQLKAVQKIAAAKTTIEAGDNVTVEAGSADGSYKISATDTTLKADTNALSLKGNTLNLSVEDTAGNKVTGSVDLKSIQDAVDTDTTYTMTGTENAADNTTTISLKDNAGKEQKVTVATKDTNTYTTGGTYDANKKKLVFTQSDPSKNYEVDVSKMISDVVNTDTTYTLEGEENDNNTTTISLTDSNGKKQQVTVATKDTRNTIVDSDTVTVEAKAQEDGSNEYKLNVKADGKIEKGNTGIVTGGTVYSETRIEKDGNYIKAGNTAGQNLTALDEQVGANTTNITKLENNIYNMGGRIGELGNRVDRVGAGPDDKWDFAAGYGNYSGANAVAIGAYYRPNEDTMFSVGGSFGGGENMVNAGVSVKLGQGNHVSTSRVAMAKDMLDMQKRMAEMEAQMAKLQGFIGALTGADAQAAMFPDVPENHWAYEYVDGLREQGIIEGYPDGNFAGDRSMTRYEFAAMLYRALAKGVSLDARAVQEFAPELARIRVDVVTKDKEGQPVIERVRVNEEQQAK
ncbi:MAG: ESPR-type extended signal peptide-containing protein [Negativicoccus succinicivorans]|uniref:ESPR-type extended signal peptide-containing protein n=2 Tax=Negativicoccus succinicivorans TaxID=620903 RepID=UPI00291513F3|nr:ESPR-type extended signal peptide-containing protein [Negativicoccus succinicivorans]MDU5943729.1 ESPR-type extended signal peptide-containing protein [Negativicoccus succinicivorans]